MAPWCLGGEVGLMSLDVYWYFCCFSPEEAGGIC
jgi:hypothetical protein